MASEIRQTWSVPFWRKVVRRTGQLMWMPSVITSVVRASRSKVAPTTPGSLWWRAGHAVEEMGGMGGPGGHSPADLLVGGVGMADGNHQALSGQVGDQRVTAFQLTGHGDGYRHIAAAFGHGLVDVDGGLLEVGRILGGRWRRR